jgi:hypothetical protein
MDFVRILDLTYTKVRLAMLLRNAPERLMKLLHDSYECHTPI